MGKCYNCGTEITLKDEETRCDNCGEILRYWCWNCKQGFNIEKKEDKTKVKECSVCGYFYCNVCGICSNNCLKNEWIETIKKIIGSDCYLKIEMFENKLQELVNFIEQLKLGKEHKKCPLGVPITYAKTKIKFAAAKMQGYDVRNSYEMNLFDKRLKEISNLPIHYEFTIGKIREDGVYGQEYRDVCNYSICLGILKVKYEINNKTKREYSLFERIEKQHLCKHLQLKDLIIDNWCPKCKRQNCGKTFVKGKNKGQNHYTIKKLTNEDICQLNRGLFKKNGGK